MDHSLEKTFIQRCLNTLVRELPVAEMSFRFDDRLDWDFIIKTAASHRILAFIAVLLEQGGSVAHLDPSVQNELKSAKELADWENRIRMLEFEKIQELFERYDVPVIPLKGVALTPLVYEKYPFRRMGDIDLLIRPVDLEKTKAFLLERGLKLQEMRNRWQSRLLARAWGRYSYTDGSLDLDLQWNPRFLISGHWVQWDQELAWRTAQPFFRMGKNVFILSPIYQAMYLSLQVLNDIDTNVPRLGQILDLALVMKRFGILGETILHETASYLNTEGCGRLSRFLEAVEKIFLRDIPYFSSFGEVPDVLHPFFCPVVSDIPRSLPVSKIIASRWERLLFFVGYLFPSEDHLSQKTHEGCRGVLARYRDHWARLFTRCLKIRK